MGFLVTKRMDESLSRSWRLWVINWFRLVFFYRVRRRVIKALECLMSQDEKVLTACEHLA